MSTGERWSAGTFWRKGEPPKEENLIKFLKEFSGSSFIFKETEETYRIYKVLSRKDSKVPEEDVLVDTFLWSKRPGGSSFSEKDLVHLFKRPSGSVFSFKETPERYEITFTKEVQSA